MREKIGRSEIELELTDLLRVFKVEDTTVALNETYSYVVRKSTI